MTDALSKQWPIKRLRYLTSRSSSDSRRTRLAQVSEASFLPMEAIGEQGQLDLSAIRPIENLKAGYSQFFDGDVVIAKITPCFENGKGALIRGTLGGVGFGTTELYVLTPGPELDGRFLYYVTVDPRFRQLGEAHMTGAAGQQRVPEDFVRDLQVPIPDLSQQRAIADHLDRETARLDALVAEKERLLDLLAEKRRALITRAVTRGLDPNVPLRDSGIPWLGEIPAHWEVIQLRYLSEDVQTGPFGSQLHASDYIAGGVPVVNPSQIAHGQIVSDERISVSEETAERLSSYRLGFGDVVFARRGEMGRCGIVNASQQGWLCGTGSLRVRLNREWIDPHYVVWIFSDAGAADVLSHESVGSTMNNLNEEILGMTRIPMPPNKEQRAITDFVRRKATRLDKLTTKTQETITLIKERRAALIAAAVTGQVDIKTSGATQSAAVTDNLGRMSPCSEVTDEAS